MNDPRRSSERPGIVPGPTPRVAFGPNEAPYVQDPTRRQVKAARVLLGWDQNDLARRAGLSRRSVQTVEGAANRVGHAGTRDAHPETEARVVEALEEAGIAFEPAGGVSIAAPVVAEAARR